VLVQEEIGRLRDAINTLIKRKTYKRRYVRVEETLIVSEVSNLITEKEGSSRKEGETPTKRVRVERYYGHCSKIRHNSRTYKIELLDMDNSDTSK
jgi:hypothetical protein